jgi:hypothetical protein
VETEHHTLEINKGDNLDSVKKLLGLGDPQLLPDPDKVIYHYHLPELGFWVFFNESNVVYSIRYEHPYPYAIGGVHVGDTKDKVLQILGKPQRYLPIPDGRNRWIYDKPPKIRLDFNNQSELVEKIFKL